MQSYSNHGGKSGVTHYKIGDGHIDVRFNRVTKDGNNTYQYDNDKAGRDNVMEMIKLAKTGSGLGSFIQHNVKDDYSKKWFSYA